MQEAHIPLDSIYLDPALFVGDGPEYFDLALQESFQEDLAGSNNEHIQHRIDDLITNGLYNRHQIILKLVDRRDLIFTPVGVQNNLIIATLKYLKKEFEKNGTKAIGNLNPALFSAVPVILNPESYLTPGKLDVVSQPRSTYLTPRSRTTITLPKSIPINILFDNHEIQHLIDLNISSYKSLSGITVNKLNKINLFAGENNSGKTSLLEAIRLLLAQNDANDFLHIQQLRGKFAEDKLMPFWVIDTVRNTIKIEGHFGQETNLAKIEIQPGIEDDDTLNGADYLGSFHFKGAFMDSKHSTNLRLFETKNYNLSIKGKTNHLCKFAYYSPFGGYRASQLYNAHAESIEKKHLPKVIAFLQSSIDENITNIRLVEKYGLKRFLIEHKNFKHAVDLIQFGDGLQNIFRTTILFSIAENGILLIDEMETAIHHSLLIEYTKFIQELAEEFNTQVFITSHSGECIDAFVNNGHKNDEISMYNMEVEDGQVACKHITGTRYKELNDLMGIDLRD